MEKLLFASLLISSFLQASEEGKLEGDFVVISRNVSRIESGKTLKVETTDASQKVSMEEENLAFLKERLNYSNEFELVNKSDAHNQDTETTEQPSTQEENFLHRTFNQKNQAHRKKQIQKDDFKELEADDGFEDLGETTPDKKTSSIDQLTTELDKLDTDEKEGKKFYQDSTKK